LFNKQFLVKNVLIDSTMPNLRRLNTWTQIYASRVAGHEAKCPIPTFIKFPAPHGLRLLNITWMKFVCQQLCSN